MNTPASVPPPRPVPLVLRLVRSLALLGLAVAFTLILSLFVLSRPAMAAVTDTLLESSVLSSNARSLDFAAGLTVALILLTPVALLLLAWRLRLRSWWWIGGGYLAVAPVVAYLASDDPGINHPVTIEEIAPSFPGAETSFAVLMRYGRQHPSGKGFTEPKNAVGGTDLTKSATAGPWLAANRDKIMARWAELAPVRGWWAELNTFDRIGDLTQPRPESEILSFAAVRANARTAAMVAGLQALDGHGDAAFATLLPLLEVGRKLEVSSRLVVTLMIARVVQRSALDAATYVLDTTTVSPAVRAQFAAALAGGGGEAGARRIFDLEQVETAGIELNYRLGDMVSINGGHEFSRLLLNFVSPVLYNAHHTANLEAGHLSEMGELAAHRQTDRIGPREEAFVIQDGHPQFKNMFGVMLLGVLSPSLSSLEGNYWKLEDQRAALLARLTGP